MQGTGPLTAKQKAVLLALHRSSGRLPVHALAEQSGAVGRTVGSLARRGLVERFTSDGHVFYILTHDGVRRARLLATALQ